MIPEDACPCGAPIRNTVTESGSIRLLETTPHPDGQYIIVERADGTTRARILTGREMPADDGTGYRAHRCPPPPTPGPLCLGCGQPMNPRGFYLRIGWTEHPACLPEFVDQIAAEARAAARRHPRTRKAKR